MIFLIYRNHHQSISCNLNDYLYRRARIQNDDVEAKVENMITKAKAVKIKHGAVAETRKERKHERKKKKK